MTPNPEIAWIGPAVPVDPQPTGWRLTRYADADELLLSAAPFGHEVFVVSAALAGMSALELLGRLRRRTDACVILSDDRGGASLALQALEGGADMVLPAPTTWRLLQAAWQALQRRFDASDAGRSWALQEARRVLVTPAGARVTLSDHEMAVMVAFAGASGQPVSRDLLAERLWGDTTRAPSSNALHAVVYRLRRRVEEESGTPMPLRSVPGAGYEFNGRLVQDE